MPLRSPSDQTRRPALAVADAALGGTVASLVAATGLPLAVVDPLPDAVGQDQVSPNQIAVNYVSPATLEVAGDDVTADTLGVGGPRPDTSGGIASGWIGILADNPEPTRPPHPGSMCSGARPRTPWASGTPSRDPPN